MVTPQITSTKNPLVKRIRALADRDRRESDDRLVVEGVRMIEEVLASGAPVELLLYDPKTTTGPRAAALLERARGLGVRLVTATPQVVAACSQVDTPQGLVAIVHHVRPALTDVLAAPDLVVAVADRIQDPGNLGTIIRIADAAGATAVLTTQGTVDSHNSKAVRATMGSLFHLPVASAATPKLIAVLRERGVRILLADPAGSTDYTEADYRPSVAIVLGSEAGGPDPAWRDAASATVRIPVYGPADSLNVAAAAALLLYEIRRAPRGSGREG